MNRFSDLQATDLYLEISLRAITDNGAPWAQVTVNDKVLWRQQVFEDIVLTHRMPLLDPFVISVAMQDKVYNSQKETALIIQSVCVDGFVVIPRFNHHSRYHNERNQCSPTNYLGFNGVWSLNVPEPFYRWRHRVLDQGWLLEPV